MKMSIIKICLVSFFLSFVISSFSTAQPNNPTVVGILSFPGDPSEETPKPLVRLGFVKKSDWEVINEEVSLAIPSWFVAFDGRNIGTISTLNKTKTDGTSRLVSEKRSLQVSSETEKIKKFDNPKGMFHTWMGKDQFRPMVVVSKKNTSDPEAWKPSNPASVILDAKKSFLDRIEPISICDKETFEEKEKRKVTLEETSLISAYSNKLGEHIVGLKLSDYWNTTNCDGVIDEQFTPHWFYVKGKNTELIGREIIPVDAGDYDNDGRSEWIFQIARYNEDGYAMFPLKTKKLLQFTWHYH